MSAVAELIAEETIIGNLNTDMFNRDKTWSTMLSNMDGIASKAMFESFGHQDVMSRIKANRPDIFNMPITAVRKENGEYLTIKKPGFEIIQPRDVMARAADLFPDATIKYDGAGKVNVVDKMEMPNMDIKGEAFAPMWNINFHADGYGKNAWTAFIMRLVCSNGMMTQSPLTSAYMNITQNGSAEERLETLTRLMRSSQNPDKAYALVDKIDEIQGVYASVREVNTIKNAVFNNGKVSDNRAANAWTSNWLMNDMPDDGFRMTGSRAARTATKVPLYDVLNLASEIASNGGDGGNDDDVNLQIKMGKVTADILKKGPDLCAALGKHGKTEFRETFTKESDIKDARAAGDETINKWLAMMDAQ